MKVCCIFSCVKTLLPSVKCRIFRPTTRFFSHTTAHHNTDFVAFDCTSQEPAARGHVAYVVQKSSKTASKGAQNGSQCPGNERCGVESLPVHHARHRAPLAALHNYIPAAGTLSVSFILSPCNLTLASLLPPLSPPAVLPQPRARCANHLFSETSFTTLVRLRSYLDLYRCGSLLCSFAHFPITPFPSAAWPLG